MTIHLSPETEQLLQKQLERGAFAGIDDVIHRALQALEAEGDWLQQHRNEISAKIELGLAQFERGEGLSAEEALALLESKKAALRSDQQRG